MSLSFNNILVPVHATEWVSIDSAIQFICMADDQLLLFIYNFVVLISFVVTCLLMWSTFVLIIHNVFLGILIIILYYL